MNTSIKIALIFCLLLSSIFGTAGTYVNSNKQSKEVTLKFSDYLKSFHAAAKFKLKKAKTESQDKFKEVWKALIDKNTPFPKLKKFVGVTLILGALAFTIGIIIVFTLFTEFSILLALFGLGVLLLSGISFLAYLILTLDKLRQKRLQKKQETSLS